MKIACIGGGPGGLYFSILMKRTFPDSEISVFERNRPDDTFGFGVVFSDETLGGFRDADPESFEAITAEFAYWTDIENYYGDQCVVSTGHGFCGMARKTLLQIFHRRCEELGIELNFETEVGDVADLKGYDMILAADGLNSIVREKYSSEFKPSIDWRKAKFAWFGTPKPLKAFTFIFKESEHGLFQIHAYPFQVGDNALSTWIVECHEDVWKRAGLEHATEEENVAYVQNLFAEELGEYGLLTNRSVWRSFPTIKCEKWYHKNIALLGDCVHTAHFSIGSGTKLAMEDAIALVDAFKKVGTSDVPLALAHYGEARRVDTIKTQKAAQTSLEWFENSERYTEQHPLQFMFNLMTRSKRITYDNLNLRDPALVKRVTEWFAEDQGMPRDSTGKYPVPIFAALRLREMELNNRMVVSPMCQYSAVEGVPNDWHLMHLGARAVGGAGLLFTEATSVSSDGRITHGCTGLHNDQQEAAWKRIADFVHTHSNAKFALQLGHAGRKASCSLPWEGDAPLTGETAWQTLGPSAVPFNKGWHVPTELTRAGMDEIIAQFEASTRRAMRVGFDMLELHMAHGYLLSSFLSPKGNHRQDEYGGSVQNRLRFPLEVFRAVRALWPAEKPMSIRVSATDWLEEGGMTMDDSVEVVREFQAHGLDLIDVSSGGNTPESVIEYGRMYQVPFAERLRHELGIKTMAVGAIQGPDHANTILAAGRADLCALARPHLVNPHITLGACATYEHYDLEWPKPYAAGAPQPRRR
jgi:anthraniloyl-CoA monooxygenase